MRYAAINNPENEREKKKKGGGGGDGEEKRGGGERKKKYDPYTNEMVRKTRCAIQSRTDNFYNLKMNDQRGQL